MLLIARVNIHCIASRLDLGTARCAKDQLHWALASLSSRRHGGLAGRGHPPEPVG